MTYCGKEGVAECRFCYETARVNCLCSPCGCRGSIQYVHLRCLRRWLRKLGSANERSGSVPVCSICQEPYKSNLVKTRRKVRQPKEVLPQRYLGVLMLVVALMWVFGLHFAVKEIFLCEQNQQNNQSSVPSTQSSQIGVAEIPLLDMESNPLFGVTMLGRRLHAIKEKIRNGEEKVKQEISSKAEQHEEQPCWPRVIQRLEELMFFLFPNFFFPPGRCGGMIN